jgi:hypothetical protein
MFNITELQQRMRPSMYVELKANEITHLVSKKCINACHPSVDVDYLSSNFILRPSGIYPALNGNLLPTFRDNLSVLRLSHKSVKKTNILCSVKSQKIADLKIFKSVDAKILLQCWKQLIITGGRIVLTTTIGAGSSAAKLHALCTYFPTDPHV